MSRMIICFLCNASLSLYNHGLCSHCTKNILLSSAILQCIRCGLPTINTNKTCLNCQAQAPPWNLLFSVTDYQSPLATFIHSMKYNHSVIYIPMLARLLLLRYLYVRRLYQLPKPDRILSVPMSRRALVARGFNQSEQLAKHLLYWLNVPFYASSLKKVKHTATQRSLNRQERQHNLRNGFECSDDLTGQKILLIDDVVTTGHTIKSVAECLIQQNSAHITVLCLCRTL